MLIAELTIKRDDKIMLTYTVGANTSFQWNSVPGGEIIFGPEMPEAALVGFIFMPYINRGNERVQISSQEVQQIEELLKIVEFKQRQINL